VLWLGQVANGMINIKELKKHHVSAVMEAQRLSYVSSLHEAEEVFASRRKIFKRGCLGCFEHDRLLAYVFCHPWVFDSIVPLGKKLSFIPESPTCLYIHDLAVIPEARHRGLATELLKAVFAIADGLNLKKYCLVAVQGSEEFWIKHGFFGFETIVYAPGIQATWMGMVRD
jgi:GNAT superfamily N-acetyltransferase